MKNVKSFAVIGIALLVIVIGNVNVAEGALVVDTFQDLIPDVGGGTNRQNLHMDIDYDAGWADNLMVRDPDSGIDTIVSNQGIWHFGGYKIVPEGIVFGMSLSTDNVNANDYPDIARGWLLGYVYASVFSVGEELDGIIGIYDPDGGQFALNGVWISEFEVYALVFDENVIQYSTGDIEFDGVQGDLSGFDFTYESFARVPHMVINPVPEPATIALLGIGCLLLRKRRK